MKGTKGLLVIVLLLVVLAAVSAGCAKSDTAAIEDTIRVYFNAWNAQNYEELLSYIPGIGELSEQDKATVMSMIKTQRETMGEITLQKIENIAISDSTAKADVTGTVGNTTNTGELTLVKEDGAWKVSPPGSGGGEETPKSTPKSTQTQALTSVYDSPAYGIRIAYPHDWTKQEGLGGTVVTFLSPKESDSDLGTENLSISWEDLSAQPMTLNEYTQKTISQLQQIITDYHIIDSGETALADRPAHEVVFTGKQGQYMVKVRVVWAVENNKAYIITYAGEESNYANYQEIVDQMIDSFEIY